MGWVLFSDEPAEEERYAPDLIADPVVLFVDRTFVLWAIAGLALPFGLGVALTGSIFGGLMGLLWGGAVRIFFLHHITFCVNSLCHFFGRRDFDTEDSRGTWPGSLPSPSARPGTTTITPSRHRRGTASAAPSSIRPPR